MINLVLLKEGTGVKIKCIIGYQNLFADDLW